MKENEQNANKNRKSGKTKLKFTIDLLAFLLMLSMIGTGLIVRYILPPGSGGRGRWEGLSLWGMDRHDWGDLHFWLALGIVGLLVLHVALHWSWICNYVRRHLGRNTQPAKLSKRASVAIGIGFVVLLNGMIIWFMWASNSSVCIIANSIQSSESMSHKVDEEEWAPPREELLEQADAIHVEGEHDCDKEHSSKQRLGRGRNSLERRSSHKKSVGRGRYVSGGTSDKGRNAGRRGRNSSTEIAGTATVRGHMTLKEVSNRTGVPVDTIKAALNLPGRVSSKDRLGQLKRKYGFQIEDVRRIVVERGGAIK